MDAFGCIVTKLDTRECGTENIHLEIKQKLFEAARSAGIGLKTQHWKFIIVEKNKT